MKNTPDTIDQDVQAIKPVFLALAPLSESGRQFVLKAVSDRLRSLKPANGMPGDEQEAGSEIASILAQPSPALSDPPKLPPATSVKDFVKTKKPVTEVQRIACLAYFCTHNQKLTEFKTKDLTRLNSEAACPQFSNASVTVGNAVRNNRFLAQCKSGAKRITTIGEAVVSALPDQGAVKNALAQYRKPRKRKNKQSKANPK